MENNTRELFSKLKDMKPGDTIWAVVKENLFKTYTERCGDSSWTYFGHWDKPYRDTSYSVNCIEGKSPKVYKLKKLFYVGVFESKGAFEYLYVFSDKGSLRDLRFTGYVLPMSRSVRSCYSYSSDSLPDISIDIVFNNFNSEKILDHQLVALDEEEGLKICRELNGNWARDMRYINFTEHAPYIKKTLKNMLKQLDDFTRSEYMVDPKEAIKHDLIDGQ